MADVKVPALLHKMSKAAQKAWYKKNNMAMPDDAGGRSAAAAKRVKVAPRKEIAVEPNSVRAINAAKQKAYMAKGGRQPIGAAGSGGHSSMAGSNMSTAKGIVAGIKAGYNPKVSLDPYESEKAKKVGPRSLKLKKESVDKEMIGEVSRMMDKVIKKPSSVDIASDVTKFLERGGKVTVYKPQKAKFRAGTALASKHDTTVAKAAGGKHVMRNQIGKNLGLARAGLLNKMLTPSKKEKFATESVELDEVTKKEAEAVIGGPVKEKPKMPPGKQWKRPCKKKMSMRQSKMQQTSASMITKEIWQSLNFVVSWQTQSVCMICSKKIQIFLSGYRARLLLLKITFQLHQIICKVR